MTSVEIDHAVLVIKEHFGDIPSRVFEFIIQNHPVPLKAIITRGKFVEKDAKKSLWILIQHHLVEISVLKPGQFFYKANLKYALQRTRHIRFIRVAQVLFGEEGGAIVERLSKHGKVDMNKVIDEISEQQDDPSLSKVKLHDIHSLLEKNNFITKISENPASYPMTVTNDNSMKLLSNGKRKNEDTNDNEGNKKKPKLEKQMLIPPVMGLWSLNLNKFHEHWTHQVITEAITQRIDKRAADVIKAVLNLSNLEKSKRDASKTRTGGVSYNDLLNHFRQQPSPGNINQILALLTSDSIPLVIKDGESDGGMYKIDFKQVFTELCKAHIDSVVQERYGSPAVRIFKVIQMNKVLDQKQIESLVMLDLKITRDYLFRLLKDDFLCQPEVPKGTDYMPTKTFYFFSVNLPQVSKMLLNQCYKAASNLIRRRDYEAQNNKRLVDKQRRLEAIMEQIEDEEQRRELEEQMTPAERTQVTTYMKASEKIEKAEIKLDETIFIIETYLSLITEPLPPAPPKK